MLTFVNLFSQSEFKYYFGYKFWYSQLMFCLKVNSSCILWLFLSSNFGVIMVLPSKKKLVTAKEVLAAGPQPRPTMESIIITLMHLAMHSEKIELEVVTLSMWSRSRNTFILVWPNRICKFMYILNGLMFVLDTCRLFSWFVWLLPLTLVTGTMLLCLQFVIRHN